MHCINCTSLWHYHTGFRPWGLRNLLTLCLVNAKPLVGDLRSPWVWLRRLGWGWRMFQSFECQLKSVHITVAYHQSPGSFTLVPVLLHSPEPSLSCCHSDPQAALHSLLTPLPTSSFKLTQSKGWPCLIKHLPTQTQLIFACQSISHTALLEYCRISQWGGFGLHLFPSERSHAWT